MPDPSRSQDEPAREEMTSLRSWTRPNLSKHRLLFAAAAVVLVGAVVTGLLVGVGSSGSGAYILTTARTGSVATTIEVSGTIEPTTAWGLSFGGAGTVASVDVVPGQQVVAGQALAQLDTTALINQLDQAQAALRAAQAKLAQDSSGPTPAAQAAASASVSNANASVAAATTSLHDDQQALADDQQLLVADQVLVDSPPGHGMPVPGYPPGASQGTTQAVLGADEAILLNDELSVPPGAGSGGGTGTTGQSGGAQTAASAAQAAITTANRVIGDFVQLAGALTSLNNAQANYQATQAPPLPSLLAGDQAAIASANAAVSSAQQQLSTARLVSPGNGVVASVNITPGQPVTNSGGAPTGGGAAAGALATGPSGAIVVDGSQGYLVAAQVTDAQVAQVHPGEAAFITPAGATSPVPGRVTSVTPLGETTQGVVAFPVDIAITGNPPGLYAGAGAQVGIVVSQAKGVVTVPTSSVHTVGAKNYVLVLEQGKPTRQVVHLGPGDATRTAITSGLSAGTQVVIASKRAKVPNPSGRAPGGKKGGGAAGLLGGGGRGGGKRGRG